MSRLPDKDPTPTKLTKPHRLLHALLRTMGFAVEDEVPVDKYRLDCFVREVWCGFECDGKRIHAGQKKQQKDSDRDKWVFDNAGIPVMRIQSDALQFAQWEKLKPLIIEFIELYTKDEKDWKARQQKGVELGV